MGWAFWRYTEDKKAQKTAGPKIPPKPEDPILAASRRAHEAHTREEAIRAANARRPSYGQNILDGLESLGRAGRMAKAAFNMAADTWRWAKPKLGPIPRMNGRLYNHVAYKTDANGQPEWVAHRAVIAFALVAGLNGAGLWYGVPMAVRGAIGIGAAVGEFAIDGIAYGMTSSHERGRFQTPNLIDPVNRTFRVSVCEKTDFRCSPNDVTTYLIRDSWFFDFLEWMKFKPSYYPDYVQGVVTEPGLVCDFTSWGFENFKFVRRYLTESKIYDIRNCERVGPTPNAPQ